MKKIGEWYWRKEWNERCQFAISTFAEEVKIVTCGCDWPPLTFEDYLRHSRFYGNDHFKDGWQDWFTWTVQIGFDGPYDYVEWF